MKTLGLGMSLLALVLAPAAVLAQAPKPEKTAVKVEETKPTGEGNSVKDTWLTTKTKSKLFLDSRVKGRRINVETRAGVVVLRGKVESADEKNAAGQIAKGVDDVVAVTNLLQIVPEGQRRRTDAKDDDIKEALGARLKKDAQLKDADIKIRSDAGLVTLMGTVPDARSRARAVELTRGVPGVKEIRNELR